jgi:hypothetical protein
VLDVGRKVNADVECADNQIADPTAPSSSPLDQPTTAMFFYDAPNARSVWLSEQ